MSGECDKCGEHALECGCPLHNFIRDVDQWIEEGNFPSKHEMILAQIMRTAIDSYIQRQGMKMEWISVKDRLPPLSEHVVFYYNNEFHIGYFIGKANRHDGMLWQSHTDGYNCVQDVEHWIPLPEPPKE